MKNSEVFHKCIQSPWLSAARADSILLRVLPTLPNGLTRIARDNERYRGLQGQWDLKCFCHSLWNFECL